MSIFRGASRWALVAVIGAVALGGFAWSVRSARGGLSDRRPETAPSPVHDASFNAVVVGDHGTGDAVASQVGQQAQAWVRRHGAEAFITTGDNVYPDGAAADLEAAWAPYRWASDLGLVLAPALGNHDFHTNSGGDVIAGLGLPGAYFEVSVGSADLFVLDSNRVTDPAQSTWVAKALAASSAPWQIVVFHYPAFSCANHDSTPEVIADWVPLFERYGVDLVLNGHDHTYQRFAPRRGVTYVVTGGGGAKLYALDECGDVEPRRVARNASDHHFLAIEGSTNRLRVRAIASDGETFDDFTIEHPDPGRDDLGG